MKSEYERKLAAEVAAVPPEKVQQIKNLVFKGGITVGDISREVGLELMVTAQIITNNIKVEKQHSFKEEWA